MLGYVPWSFHELTNRHPKTAQEWNRQQRFASVPGLGSLYRGYMVNQSLNERNDYLRNLYGYGNSGNPVGMFPWLSGINNNNPGAQVAGSVAQTALGSIMRIYGRGMRDNKPDQPRYQHHLDEWY